MPHFRNALVITAALTATVGTGAAVAHAGTPARATSTINACQAKSGGALRVASTCKASEKAISWSITGPAGPRGAQGPAGAKGAQGPAGVVDVYQAVTSPTATVPKTFTKAIGIGLPAGTYLVDWSVPVENGTSSNDFVECKLSSNDGDAFMTRSFPLDAAGPALPGAVGTTQTEATYDGTIAVTLPSSTSVEVDCLSFEGKAALGVGQALITATPVDAVLNGV